jgi:transcriptional regulator of NAD metabolism
LNSESRRKTIDDRLSKSDKPVKGSTLAEELGVTRQVIVKDIAILRAQGEKIIATPDGYIKAKEQNHVFRKVIATCHKSDEIEEELSIMVKFGGIIEDVIVEHPLYGVIKAMLMIKTLYDVQNFVKKIKEYKAEPLMVLTGGIHLHTVAAESNEILEKIEEELNNKKYLIT